MIKRTLVLPREDNHGVSLDAEIAQAESILLKLAGGFTATYSYGEWIGADGKRFRDRSKTLTMVVDAGTDASIDSQLPHLAALLRQEALYSDTVAAEASFTAPALTPAATAA